MRLFDQLKQGAASEWDAYVDHAFVRGLGDGTLPEAAFRHYLVQDYLFLIQFARAHALAAFKSRDLADMRAHARTLHGLLDTEMSLHIRLSARWGLSEADLVAPPEARATVAYTRFVIDEGLRGDLLDLSVALIPCIAGYAEIGQRLARRGVAAGNPYAEWIADYAGTAYGEIAEGAIADLDRLAERTLAPARLPELTRLFAAACRLEADFWQMGLDRSL